MKFERIFCFGDSITLGCNDSQGLGWPGRLCRGLKHGDDEVAAYNLGVNGDTSRDIELRWRAEAEVRSRNSPGLLLFAFGFNDAAKADGAGAGAQVDLAASIATAGRIMSAALSISQVLWIGPTPLDESVNPMQTDDASWVMCNADIETYDQAYAALASDIGVDYLQLFPEFLSSPRYQAALTAGDRVHPGDDGYAMIAEQIASWEKWLEQD